MKQYRFSSDRHARDVIEGAFTIDPKFIIRLAVMATPTEEQWQAMCYLCDEWDYGYEKDHTAPAQGQEGNTK